MDNIADVNLKIAIAFSLVMITALLTYIAFFKKSVELKKASDIV